MTNENKVFGCGENATDEELGLTAETGRQTWPEGLDLIERVSQRIGAALEARVTECFASRIDPIRDERRAALKAASEIVGEIMMDF